jgi:hypothetical protein
MYHQHHHIIIVIIHHNGVSLAPRNKYQVFSWFHSFVRIDVRQHQKCPNVPKVDFELLSCVRTFRAPGRCGKLCFWCLCYRMLITYTVLAQREDQLAE